MQLFNFKSFIKEGKFLDFDQNTTEQDIINRLGTPSEIEDYGNAGKYLHYYDLRLSIRNGELNEIDFFFMNSEMSFELETDNDLIIIKKDTSVFKILKLLNQFNLRWNISYSNYNLDYMVIDIPNGIKFFYYYDNEQIERVTKIW